MFRELEINPTICDGSLYITAYNYADIICAIHDYAQGAPLDEVFNMGI